MLVIFLSQFLFLSTLQIRLDCEILDEVVTRNVTSNFDLPEYLHNWVEEGGKKDAKVLREK